MPRKKSLTVPILFPDGPTATRRSRSRKIITDIRSETGDPWQDGDIWLSRIMMTRRARANRKNGEKDWRRYYRWYKGEQWNDRGDEGGQINSDNARDTATVNKTGSIVNSIVPFLINDEIKFLLKPQRPTDDISAIIQQALLNYEWRERKITEQMKRCARDLVTIGHCVAKTGYTVEVDESRKPNQDGEINYSDYVVKDAPWAERVNPLNFVFDLTARDHTLHTARWCAEIFFVPYADVLSNQNYDRETLAMMRSGDATPTTQAAWEMLGVDPRSMKAMGIVALPEDNLVALIGVWDKKYKNYFILADGCPRPLLVEDWPYDYLEGFPYAMRNYIEVPNEPYGLGLPAWVEDQQMQLNRMRTNEFNWIRANQPKFNIPENTNSEEVTKWQEGGPGTGVVTPIPGIQPIPMANLSVDFDKTEARLQRDIEEMTGADALLQGARLPSRTTAGEVGTRARLTGLKLDQHVTDFEEFVEEIAVQVLHHLKKNRTTDDVIQVVGLQGAQWVQYTPDDIKADTDVEVEYFAAPKTDPDLEKQQAIEIFQLAVQALPVLAQTGAPDTFDIPALVGWVLDKFGEKNIGRFFRPARTPLQPIQEGQQPQQSMNAGAGLPPALAGQSAPAPVPQTANVSAPGQGNSVEDLMQSMRGLMQ